MASAEAAISVNNRSFRYGEGFFETMKWADGACFLWELHVSRIIKSANCLSFEFGAHFSLETLSMGIAQLLRKNGHHKLARVRCTFFRGDGGLFDADSNRLNYLVQSWSIPEEQVTWNTNGLDLGIYRGGIKQADGFSWLKSNSALTYTMAAQYAKDQRWNDAILLNHRGRVADTCIANLFIAREGVIITPPIQEGGVEGVARAWLLRLLPSLGYQVAEAPIGLELLATAEEVFLTNALRGVRWVKWIEDIGAYSCKLSKEIAENFLKI